MKEKNDSSEAVRLHRIEQKIDQLQKFLNNEYQDLTEEVEKLNKNFTSLEVMFYVLLGPSVLTLVVTLL